MDYRGISIEFRVPNSSNEEEINPNLQKSKKLIEILLKQHNIIDRDLTNQEMIVVSALSPILGDEDLEKIISHMISNNPEEIVIEYPHGNTAVINLVNFRNEQESI